MAMTWRKSGKPPGSSGKNCKNTDEQGKAEMDGFHYCPAPLFFNYCECDQRRKPTHSLTTKLAIRRGLGMSPTSRFSQFRDNPKMWKRSICIYRCPACEVWWDISIGEQGIINGYADNLLLFCCIRKIRKRHQARGISLLQQICDVINQVVI